MPLMKDQPARTVADGVASYRARHRDYRPTPTADADTSSGPSVEALTASRVLLGRTRHRAAHGDRAARDAVRAYDAAYRALADASSTPAGTTPDAA